ncbi:hypothetical protein KAFR_0A03830 [Kazachstania africana CBS 2517]|uniref:RRM domain-containing protein n=1 Tax=Kazachstania africana (strain ATCC 22294 / BCRC 22015 / CBS 2517 / CECT 1963 / NBRC 1671 / NRRL Y-8276) TaxID=1071382 RepID=H2AN68_KAZAF|nr:hypothetical protein KAFR_0A03830 [Kazachstania africana CBS 2517]CCF55818.1 hypothetical protein KAFR_0A03830 [Kazachstania africana CBS 2517]
MTILTKYQQKPRHEVDSLSHQDKFSKLAAFTSLMLESPSHELFGFRRMARSYLYGSADNKRNIKRQAVKQEHFSIKRSKVVCSKKTEIPIISKYSNNDTTLHFGKDRAPSTKTEKLHVSGEMYDSSNIKGSEMFVSPTGTKVFDNEGQGLEALILSHEGSKLDTSKRNIVIKNIPSGTGLASVMSQVCGGPLENISFQTAEKSINILENVRLSFLTADAADAFMNYSKTRLFKVNGFNLITEWAPLKQQPINNIYSGLEKQQAQFSTNICRSLIMKKYPQKKEIKKYCKWMENTMDDFDPSIIVEDFGQFGRIQEVTPIISRKLCVAVNYYNILSALKAIESYEDPNSELHRKYYKSWAIWFGKDITDKPCIEL